MSIREGWSDWLTDSNGKKYRTDGRVKEYEMIIQTSYGMIPESMLKETNLKQMKDKMFEATRAFEASKQKKVTCPLRDMLECNKECVFFNGGKCVYGTKQAKAAGFCPLSRRTCNENCAMNTGNGCRL